MPTARFDKIMAAHRTLEDLHLKHRIELDKFLQAHEAIEELARKERMDLMETMNNDEDQAG